jgi:hypothetical protein
MLHLLNEVPVFVIVIVVVGYVYAIGCAIRGWHKYAYVPVERYLALKSHTSASGDESCYYADLLEGAREELREAEVREKQLVVDNLRLMELASRLRKA